MNIKDIFIFGFKIFLFILIALFLYFNFALVIFLLILIIFFLYSVTLYYKLYEAFLSNKIFIRIVFMILLSLWIINWGVALKQEFCGTNYSFYDFLVNIGVFLMGVDIVVWVEIKFLEQFSSIRIKKELDPNNPKRLKSEIESLINELNFKENPDLIKLYEILQISVLSIKKQRRIIRSSFLKNLLLSLLFFVLGLIIPKIIVFIFSL